MDPIVINALVFQQDGLWVAQCLEYNLVSCAKSQEDLPEILLRQILDQIESDLEDGHEPFFEFDSAPAKYWTLYEAARLHSGCREFQDAGVEAHLFPVTFPAMALAEVC